MRHVVGARTAWSYDGGCRHEPRQFFLRIIASGFRFNKMAAKDVARQTEGSPADTLARFKEQLTSTSHPPGPMDTWLGETIVHSEDIRRPLGISHSYPTDALARLADFYRGSNLIVGGKKRAAGLTLRATDADWSAGSGPVVAGPILSLVMATTGRPTALDDLAGEGIDALRQRV